MKRLAALACLLAAGCASGPGEGSPRTVLVLLAQDAAQVERDRQIMRQIFGSEALSNGELMREVAIDELRARGYDVAQAKTGTPEGEALEALRASGGSEGLLVVTVGPWNLDSVATANQATVEYELVLRHASDGRELWADRVARRTIALRTGEHRDLEALVRRLVLQSLRSYP